MAMALGGYAIANALKVEEFRQQSSEENGHARHVIESLVEETTATKVSKTDALNTIESLGYLLDDAKVGLIQDSTVDRTYWEILAGKILFKIDASTGELLAISDNNVYESKSSEVDSENAVEMAQQKIVAISELPADIGEPLLELKERRGGIIYRVFWQQDKDGIPVESGYMSVELDTSGRIRHFRKFWQDLEVNTLAKVTKDEAIKIAQEKVVTAELPALLWERIGKAENVYASLVIEKPYNPLDKSKPILGQYCLVWEVVFERGTERSYENVELSIDAHSGELVGINFTK